MKKNKKLDEIVYTNSYKSYTLREYRKRFGPSKFGIILYSCAIFFFVLFGISMMLMTTNPLTMVLVALVWIVFHTVNLILEIRDYKKRKILYKQICKADGIIDN